MLKKRYAHSLIICTLLGSSCFASAWKIPVQSAQSIALAGAYISASKGSQTSYYNPANMSFNEDKNEMDFSLIGVYLNSVNYKDNTDSRKDGNSQIERVLIPGFFYSSKDINGFRFGLSSTAPGGLTKRWDDVYPKKFAEKFSLKIMELNPVISYKLAENLSIAAGFRTLYSQGDVKSDGEIFGALAKRDMKGDSFSYGYNLSIAYKPTNETNLSLNYRSNVNINQKGDAKLFLDNNLIYSDKASVQIPLPASLGLSYAHNIDKWTMELVYEKVYWSKYKELDFKYDKEISDSFLKAVFDDPSKRNWKDTSTKRLGVSYEYDKDLKLMIGYAIDETPSSTGSISFDLPDSDSKIYSLGYEYKLSSDSKYSLGYLYTKKDEISVSNRTVDGHFKNSAAHLIGFSYSMSF